MPIEHDYFGILADDDAGGVCWAEPVTAGDQTVDVRVKARDIAAVSEIVIELAAAFIRELEGFDARARDAMIAQLSERESVTTQYIDYHVDGMGESLLDLLVHNSGDIPMDVLRSLQLVRVDMFPERVKDGEVFAAFDYAIDTDSSDYPLIVSYDIQGDISAIEVTD